MDKNREKNNLMQLGKYSGAQTGIPRIISSLPPAKHPLACRGQGNVFRVWCGEELHDVFHLNFSP